MQKSNREFLLDCSEVLTRDITVCHHRNKHCYQDGEYKFIRKQYIRSQRKGYKAILDNLYDYLEF